MSNKPKKQGFSLVEIIMALAIISIGIVGQVHIFSTALRGPSLDKVKIQASFLANDLMEEILIRRWRDRTSPSNDLGPEGNERRSGTNPGLAFDDIDDYTGLDNSPPQTPDEVVMDGVATAENFVEFGRKVTVIYAVVDTATNTVRPATAGEIPSEYKQISVTVTHKAIPDYTINALKAD